MRRSCEYTHAHAVFACNTVFIVINTVYVPLTVPGVRAVDLVSDYL